MVKIEDDDSNEAGALTKKLVAERTERIRNKFKAKTIA